MARRAIGICSRCTKKRPSVLKGERKVSPGGVDDLSREEKRNALSHTNAKRVGKKGGVREVQSLSALGRNRKKGGRSTEKAVLQSKGRRQTPR